MPAHVVVGTQWGDEAKARFVDYLADEADIIARFNGGANAGHTVLDEDGHGFISHIIPSGIIRRNVRLNVIANGTVVDIQGLFDTEFIDAQKAADKHGINVLDRLMLSGNAHAVLQFHKAIEVARANLSANARTTSRGIGPTYAAKHSYQGITIDTLLDEVLLRLRLEQMIPEVNGLLTHLDKDAPQFTVQEIVDFVSPYVGRLKKIVGDTGAVLRKAIKTERIIFEGAQATMLDVDHGTYPNVSSSNGTIGGVFTGTGVSIHHIDMILGIVKAYMTRVGSGSGTMVPKMTAEMDEAIRQKGAEFGATTGNPRTCAWLDLLIAKYAAEVNGLTVVAMSKLDVLDGLEKVLVCIAYEYEGKRYDTLPANRNIWPHCTPIIKEMNGWDGTKGCQNWNKLHPNAQEYVKFVEKVIGVPIRWVSTGPKRHQLIDRMAA